MIVGVTGSTGFIGTTLVKHLSRIDRFKLRCLVRRASTVHEGHEQVEYFHGDLQSPFDCLEFVQGLSVVIHLAAAGSPLTAGRSLTTDLGLSLAPTLNLLEALKSHNPRARVIYASSGGQVYGRSDTLVPWTEDDPCNPVSIYGIHKLTCEHYLRLLAEESGIRSTVLRVSNVYGEILPPERMQGFIGVAAHEISYGRPVRLIGSVANVRDYVHLEDVCRAFENALRDEHPPGTYNVGSNTGMTVEAILALMEDIIGRRIPRKEIATASSSAPASLIPWNILNNSKARCAGWNPRISLQLGLERLLAGVS